MVSSTKSLLVTYATSHGSTAEVAQHIADKLSKYRVDVDSAPIMQVRNLAKYDVVVFGSPVHNGLMLPALTHFLTTHGTTLARKHVFLFLTCILVLEQDGAASAIERYIPNRIHEHLGIPPENIRAFAGKLNWDTITIDERWQLTNRYDGKKLPDQNGSSDYRDWDQIGGWANTIAEQLNLR